MSLLDGYESIFDNYLLEGALEAADNAELDETDLPYVLGDEDDDDDLDDEDDLLDEDEDDDDLDDDGLESLMSDAMDMLEANEALLIATDSYGGGDC